MDSGLPDYQAAIDDALQLVYSQHHRLITQLHPESFRELTLADLMGTNAYEVIVGIRERMPRLFFRGGELVATRVSVDGSTSTPRNTGGTGN